MVLVCEDKQMRYMSLIHILGYEVEWSIVDWEDKKPFLRTHLNDSKITPTITNQLKLLGLDVENKLSVDEALQKICIIM